MDKALKQAAIRLMSLPQEDRQWVLAQLAPDQQQSLEKSISDLQSNVQSPAMLSHTDFSELLEQVLNEPANDHFFDEIFLEFGAGKVAQALQQEPNALVSALLTQTSAAHQEALRAHLDPVRLQAVKTATAPSLTRRTSQELVVLLKHKLVSMPDVQVPTLSMTTGSSWRKLFSRK
ncbi:MAG: hypothetical protein ING36_15255 [Burkholderiales bacterium]|nr:hypothetical protein [Burkholderiales bacterium]